MRRNDNAGVTSRPSRQLPHPGQAAEIVDLGARQAAVVTRVEGRTVWVACEGEPAERPFDLHPTTACFVARGQPYWGTRLRLDER
jgi:hypothetical protein